MILPSAVDTAGGIQALFNSLDLTIVQGIVKYSERKKV